jgi:hypothetical protein
MRLPRTRCVNHPWRKVITHPSGQRELYCRQCMRSSRRRLLERLRNRK